MLSASSYFRNDNIIDIFTGRLMYFCVQGGGINGIRDPNVAMKTDL